HGIAARMANSDPERELTPEGIAQSRSVAKKFFLQSPQLDKGFVSPYERAKQTAAEFRLAFPQVEFEQTELITPDSDPYEVLNLLEQNQEQNVILVSHNPLLSRLVSLLVDGTLESNHRVQVDTSNVFCVTMDIVAPGCGELKYVLVP
ncbi:MAG: phosphohistidine phosphatase SixA, partial [Gammaproteobacteria bacterium]|nr:phosphohistidine phosphatase SixA [Gammaproteobacteria bacterium]